MPGKNGSLHSYCVLYSVTKKLREGKRRAVKDFRARLLRLPGEVYKHGTRAVPLRLQSYYKKIGYANREKCVAEKRV